MPPCRIGYSIPNKSHRGVLIIFVSPFSGYSGFVDSGFVTNLRVYEFTNLRLFGLLLLFFDLDHFHALVAATGRTDVMRQSGFVALRTNNKLRPFQGVMGTPVIPTPLGNLSLR